MKPLERAARKLAACRYEHGADCQGLDRDQWVDQFWTEFVIDVRVVLKAIRDTGAEMVEAGARAADYCVVDLGYSDLQAIWVAMLDAATEEK